MVHAFPITILIIDYVINRIPFNFKHIIVALFIMGIYLCVNATYTLATGTPVYPIFTFKDWATLGYALGIVVLETSIFLAIHFLTRWKLRQYQHIENRFSSELNVIESEE